MVYFANFDPTRHPENSTESMEASDEGKSAAKPTKRRRKQKGPVWPGAWFGGNPPPDEGSKSWKDLKTLAPKLVNAAALANMTQSCRHIKLPKVPKIRSSRASGQNAMKAMAETENALPAPMKRWLVEVRKALRAEVGWEDPTEEATEGDFQAEAHYGTGTQAVVLPLTGFKRYAGRAQLDSDSNADFTTLHTFAIFDLLSQTARTQLSNIFQRQNPPSSDQISAIQANLPVGVSDPTELAGLMAFVTSLAEVIAEHSQARTLALKVRHILCIPLSECCLSVLSYFNFTRLAV